jgi:hypothetical protein
MNSGFLRRFLPFGLALAILATSLTTYPARADSDENDNSLAGSWLVHLHFAKPIVPDRLALAAFSKEGTFVGSLQGDGAGAGPASTPGYGSWVKTGAKTFVLRFHTITGAPDTSLVSFNTATMQLVLDAKSKFSGTWQIRGVDVNGNDTGSAEGTLIGDRIPPIPPTQ